MQLILIFIFLLGIYINSCLLYDTLILISRQRWYVFSYNFKIIILITLKILILIWFLYIIKLYFFFWDDNNYSLKLNNYSFQLDFFFGIGLISLSINELALIFLVLISLLYPLILLLMQYDLDFSNYKYFNYMIWLYFFIFLFILANDITSFYIFYEIMIALVFLIMYTTSNSRGCIEAVLFFLGWAIIGSFCLSIAIIYILIIIRLNYFDEIWNYSFTIHEYYILYCLFFFGFGTKLALWPFWYWLPRAHVEVSTGMSIFLSCILIKVCFFGLLKFIYLIGFSFFIIPFVFFLGLGVFDVTIRLIMQTDLKAITAYGSVLHINLFIILFFFDSNLLNSGLIYYIWGHSYATAGIFFTINLIERISSTRLTFEMSGIYKYNASIGFIAIFALISFLEFPLSFFFWGEIWLWIVLLDSLTYFTIVLILISIFFYIIIFFRIWWFIIFGSLRFYMIYPSEVISLNDYLICFYIIFSQYYIGIYPSLICWYFYD